MSSSSCRRPRNPVRARQVAQPKIRVRPPALPGLAFNDVDAVSSTTAPMVRCTANAVVLALLMRAAASAEVQLGAPVAVPVAARPAAIAAADVDRDGGVDFVTA